MTKKPDDDEALAVDDPVAVRARVHERLDAARKLSEEAMTRQGRVLIQAPAVDLDAAYVACTHPEHRLGTHGRLKKNQRVCLNCGEVVLRRK